CARSYGSSYYYGLDSW
nr:immunoglobulin heavy chain junction region [Macaca mulatta]